MIVFDIETGPQPWQQIVKIVGPLDEEKAVPHPGKFDPLKVKLGNLKVREKIEAKIEECRLLHEQEISFVAQNRARAANQYVQDWTDKAPLDATIGCVKAIGYRGAGEDVRHIRCVWPMDVAVPSIPGIAMIGFTTEQALLEDFWQMVKTNSANAFVGHNIHGFDLPFIMRRSYLLGIDFPRHLVMKGRYFLERFGDTMLHWQCGGRDFVKLDTLCRAFGVPGKTDGISGADFHRMFDAGGADRINAIQYLANDLDMTLAVAEGMGWV